MIFQQVTQQSPATRQLIINNTHIDPADERHNFLYDDGVPDRLIFNCLGGRHQPIMTELNPIMVIGRRRSMSDYEVNVDLTDMNGAQLGVSRYHAMMLALDNHIYIKDLDSLNGMLLNGKRMIPSREYILADGDIIALGNLELKVKFDYNP